MKLKNNGHRKNLHAGKSQIRDPAVAGNMEKDSAHAERCLLALSFLPVFSKQPVAQYNLG